jgi:hypothetical protein
LIDFKFPSGVCRFLVCGFLCFLFVAQAYARDFPPQSKAGTLNGFDRPYVKIGATTFQLAPGARIRDQNNGIILPATLPSGAKVIYKLEATTGYLFEMWLLAPGEIVTIQQ